MNSPTGRKPYATHATSEPIEQTRKAFAAEVLHDEPGRLLEQLEAEFTDLAREYNANPAAASMGLKDRMNYLATRIEKLRQP